MRHSVCYFQNDTFRRLYFKEVPFNIVHQDSSWLRPTIVLSHGCVHIWRSQQDAIDAYTEAAFACEGNDRARYLNILGKLRNGHVVAWDGGGEFTYSAVIALEDAIDVERRKRRGRWLLIVEKKFR